MVIKEIPENQRVMKFTIDTSEFKKEVSEMEQTINRITRKMNSIASFEKVKQIDELAELFKENDSVMNFGQAMEALKKGKRVARKGWNGKRMFLFIMESFALKTALYRQYPKAEDGIVVQDCICMKNAQGTVCFGWLASQADMLGEDWIVVESESKK